MEAFSHDEISDLRNIFSLMDRSGHGKISMAEMKHLLNSQSCYPNEAELVEIVAELDFDHDGAINFEDFVTYCSSRRSCSPGMVKEKEIKHAFDFLDHNGDGFVSVTDVRHVMRAIGRDVADEQVEQMLAEVDGAGSNRISYKSFKNMMMGDAF